MSAPDDLKDVIRRANCDAPDVLRRRLWQDIAAGLQQSQAAARSGDSFRAWRIVMDSRIAKPALAAAVVIAAIAFGVERFTHMKSDKTYAFNAEIRTNMALDLDPKGAIPLRDTRPEDFDVTWSGENGGSLKILPGSLVRIRAITLITPGWDDGIRWAYSHLDEIKGSTATSVVPTEKNPFAVVLTSEGNLAVIQINRRDEGLAWLNWRVEKAVSPGYSPVQIVTLQGMDEKSTVPQPCAIDLDTGRTVAIPAQVFHLPANDLLAWLEQNGIDAIARMSEEGDGLVGVGLFFWTWMPSGWADTDPVELREEMTRATYQPRRPLLFQEDRYQHVFPFKTREGTIGMLQMLAVDKAKRTVQFRYLTLQEDGTGTIKAQADSESQRLADSVRRLMKFGLLVFIYADRHDGKYPASLAELKDSAEKEQQDYQWIVANVEYVGAGKTASDPNAGETVLAYDKTILKSGKGTNAVFRDSHAEFIEPKRLSQYGIPGESQDTRVTPP
jgi:hypothetical protein